MTDLLFLLSVVAYLANAEPVKLFKDEHLRFVEFPDANKQEENSKTISELDHLPEVSSQADANRYYLFTRRNPTSSQRLQINNANSITSSHFNARLPTVIVAHGWLDNMDASFNEVVRNAYLRKSDVNFIVMDWRSVAIAVYGSAVAGVPPVGRGLGQFLNFLHRQTGAPFNNMHMVGFSLGAHVVGNAGRELGGRVARITGLDPAGPMWATNSNRLRASDAVYVEAIHTDGSVVGLGIGSAVANADFFPNGGNSQPGCYDHFCNHNRAWRLFAATLTYNHLVGRHCANKMQVTTNNCRGANLQMGNGDLNKRGSGLYRVNTQRSYPF